MNSRRRRGTLFLMLGALALCGCTDPYSQRRIDIRTARVQDLADDIARREQSNSKRLGEAGQTLRKWWQGDVDRFSRRMPTVGDYVW